MAVRACSVEYRLTQNTLLAILNEDHFLQTVPRDQWAITSFDAKTMIVCIKMTNDVSITNLTVTLPEFV